MAGEVIRIQLSKRKLREGAVFCLAFFVSGIWLLVERPASGNIMLSNSIAVITAGIGSVIVSVAGCFIIYKKLNEKRVALTIDDKGITDYSSAVSAGFIAWGDIESIQITVSSKKAINSCS